MRFGSVCSGIEAASVAWGPLGWQAAWLSEIEPWPSNLLAQHYPNVPNLGDMTALPKRILSGEVKAPDVLCGGTPCQAFSVAGLRKSLDDARGNLSLVFCEIANAIDDARFIDGDEPAVVFWENVPGVLNTKDNAFGCFLAGLAGEAEPLVAPGGKWSNAGYVLGPQRTVAWRVLDAQYFGVAQRRRRVFVVASAREGFDPAAILFEFDGVRRDTAPSREAREEVTGSLASRTDGGGFPGTDEACSGFVRPVLKWPAEVASTLDAHFGSKWGLEDQHINGGAALFVPTYTIQHAQIGRKDEAGPQGKRWQENIAFTQDSRASADVVVAFHSNAQPDQMRFDPHLSSSLTCSQSAAVAFDTTQLTSPRNFSNSRPGDPCHPLAAGAHAPSVVHSMQVRRLTPEECERLQGFPDGYTLVAVKGKPAADGPRYKALGNSWAVPNVRWIGNRIDLHLLGLL